MALHLCRGGSGISKSEQEMLTPIVDALRAKYSQSQDFCYLFFGFDCPPRQLDATLIRADAIINIELKDYSGQKAIVDPQGNITILPSRILVNRDRGESPFTQVRAQNNALRNFIFKHQKDLSSFSGSSQILNSSNIDVCGFLVFRAISEVESGHLTAQHHYFRVADIQTFLAASQLYRGKDPTDRQKTLMLDEVFVKALADLLSLKPTDTIEEAELPLPPVIQTPIRKHLEKLASFCDAGQLVSRPALERSILSTTNSIVLGAPGSGKTTLLKVIASIVAKEVLANGQLCPIPCFVALGDTGVSIDKVALECGLGDAEVAHQLLRDGKFHLMLDAVDEMTNLKVNLFQLSDFVRQYPHNRYVISARRELQQSQHYHKLFEMLEGFMKVNVESFSDNEAQLFIQTRLEEDYYREHEAEIRYFVASLPDATPLTLNMAIEIIKDTQSALIEAFENLGLFYRRFFDGRLAGEVYRNKECREGADIQLSLVLTELGYMSVKGSTQYFEARDVLNTIRNITSEEPTKYLELLLRAELLDRVKVVVTSGRQSLQEVRLQFHHQSYRDFFAATALSMRAETIEELQAILVDKDEDHTLVLLSGIERNTDIVAFLIRNALAQGKLQLAIDCLCNTSNIGLNVIREVSGVVQSLFTKERIKHTEPFYSESRPYSRFRFVFRNVWHYGPRFGILVFELMEKETENSIVWKVDWEILKSERMRMGESEARYRETYRYALFAEEGVNTGNRLDGLRLGIDEGLAGNSEAQTKQGYQLFYALKRATSFDALCVVLFDQTYNEELKSYILAKILGEYTEDNETRILKAKLQEKNMLLGPFGERYMWIIASLCCEYSESELSQETIEKHFWSEPSPIVQCRFLLYGGSSRLCGMVCERYQNSNIVDLDRIDELFESHRASTADCIFEGGDPVACDFRLEDFRGDTYETLAKCFALDRLAGNREPDIRSLLERLSFSDNRKIRLAAEWALREADKSVG
jgi:energy-coupling factor transporter ATP-binding protein EcfA2